MARTPAKTETNLPTISDEDIFADAGMGNENVTMDDKVVPRLQIVQSMSPELKKTKSEYIEGAEEGSVFNSATRQLYTLPMTIIPVAYQKRYIEWVPRTAGGGLINPNHGPEILNECTPGDKGKYLLGNNEIVVTPEHFVIVIHSNGTLEQAVMSMAGSKAKISRQWNTLIDGLQLRNPKTGQLVTPARFYGAYEFTVGPESNDQGDWMNWRVKYKCPTTEVSADAYLAAREFFKLVKSGAVQAETEAPAEDSINTNAM